MKIRIEGDILYVVTAEPKQVRLSGLAGSAMSGEVVLAGAGDHLKIRDRAAWASRLENGGEVILVPAGGVVSTGALVLGRATVRGVLDLEGREDKSAAVDFSLRPWASYRPLADSLFAAANDTDPERAGVQVLLDP